MASTTPGRSHTRGYVIATILTLLLIGGTLLILRNITDVSGHPLNTLHPLGDQARKIDDLVVPVFAIAGLVFILVEGGMIFLIARFRRSRDESVEEEDPIQIHGKSGLEWTWTAIPALILAVIAAFNVASIWELEGDAQDAKMTVEVVGQQWWWEFRYDTNEDGKPDIITANQLVIPADTMVAVDISSNDVIHSFWIPTLNGKRDAVPGRVHKIALHADKPGIYEGQCTEYCGLSHGYMRMQVKALSAADYEKWLDNQLAGPVEPKDGTPAAEGKAVFATKCASCHQIDGYDTSGAPTSSGEPDPDYGGAGHPLISGNAPNLTHLMSRDHFAGGMFPLYDSYDESAPRTSAMPDGDPNQGELGDWLRDPPGKKPMASDRARGMPNLNLTEDEIDKLVAYLTTLK